MGSRVQLVALNLALIICSITFVSATNITIVLQPFPTFSVLNALLSTTGVASEINSTSSFTLLAPDDSVLNPVVKSLSGASGSTELAANLLRYHVIPQYLDIPKIQTITNSSGDLVATLYQNTAKGATDLAGFVNLTVSGGLVKIGPPAALGAAPYATVLNSVIQSPILSFSVLHIDHVLVPIGLQIVAAPAPSPSSLAVPNITDALVKAGQFKVLLSLLQQAGLVSALIAKETGPGITLFAPTDDAFNAILSNVLAGLSQVQKTTILLYHVLPSFTSLTQLQSLTNPALQTLASGSAGEFTLNFTTSSGKVFISTGVDVAEVSTTLLNQPPAAVYAINKVLLPREIFRSTGPVPAPSPHAPSSAPTHISPAIVPSPIQAPAPASTPAIGIAPVPAPITEAFTPGASSPPAPLLSSPSPASPPPPSHAASISISSCNIIIAAASIIASSLFL